MVGGFPLPDHRAGAETDPQHHADPWRHRISPVHVLILLIILIKDVVDSLLSTRTCSECMIRKVGTGFRKRSSTNDVTEHRAAVDRRSRRAFGRGPTDAAGGSDAIDEHESAPTDNACSRRGFAPPRPKARQTTRCWR